MLKNQALRIMKRKELYFILHTSQGIFKLMGGSGLVMQIKCGVDVCYRTRFKKKKSNCLC